MPRRVTLQDIADTLGLSRSAVSRALRGSRRIPAETRERVQRKADELGYAPHPAHRYLSDCRWHRPTDDTGLALAVIQAPGQGRATLYRSILDEAQALGYSVTFFEVRRGQGAQLHRVLQARGIRGLIFSWDSLTEIENEFPLDAYSVVLARPRNDQQPYTTVRDNPFEMTTLLLDNLDQRGYRRIGLCSWQEENSAIDDRVLGAYAGFSHRRRDLVKLPPFTFDREAFHALKPVNGHPVDCPAFAGWMSKYRPDAVVGFNPLVYWWLRHLGYRLPEDVGFVEQESIMIDEQQQIGALAVHQIDTHLRQNLSGRPRHRLLLVTAPRWLEFPTVRVHAAQAERVCIPYPPILVDPAEVVTVHRL